MPDYRWFRVLGVTYFRGEFAERHLDTLVRHIGVLREALRMKKRR